MNIANENSTFSQTDKLTILASEAILRNNKNKSTKNVTTNENLTRDLRGLSLIVSFLAYLKCDIEGIM